MTDTAAARPRLHLDLPKPAVIAHPIEHLWGWMAVADRSAPVTATVGDQPLPCARIDRGGPGRIGFSLYLDLSLLTRGEGIDIMLRCGHDSMLLSLPVSAEAWGLAAEVAANRAVKAAFLAAHVPGLRRLPGLRAAAHLPDDWMLSPRLEDKLDAVSSHAYAPALLEFLSGFKEDQFILDAGAGLRKRPQRNVINLEIYDYPSTDILSIGQKLPFADDCFDAVLSIAVLEHVDDPMACAAEILRVLKPGGLIFASVPFLQPEHGYPSHYFNATRFGLRKLFQGAELVHHGVPDGVNHPIQTLHRVVTLYAAGLPADLREDFLNQSLRDLIATPPAEHLRRGTQFVSALDEDARWKLAYATSATFRKPGGRQE
jgi:SAM-dependent methyltransferase